MSSRPDPFMDLVEFFLRLLGRALGYLALLARWALIRIARALAFVAPKVGRILGRQITRLPAARALEDRASTVALPAADFDPSEEELRRAAAQLARIHARALRRRGSAIRIRFDSTPDGSLAYGLQAPAAAEGLLDLAAYRGVEYRSFDALGASLGVPAEDGAAGELAHQVLTGLSRAAHSLRALAARLGQGVSLGGRSPILELAPAPDAPPELPTLRLVEGGGEADGAA